VPTIAESGVPGFEASSWFGLFAPTATPAPVLAQISRALTKVLDKPEYKNKVIEQGGIPASDTPAQFSEFIKNETRKWSKVVRDSGATVD
jgi:tripartite-type tricarboxylate transporter receptor subunit TctC